MSFGFQILAFALSAMWSILLARGLGPEARGTYAIVGVLVGVASSVSGCGFGSANVYFRARGHDANELAGASLMVAIASAGVLAGALLLCLRFKLFDSYLHKNHVSSDLLWLAIGAALASTLYSLFNNILLGSGDIVGYNLPNVVYHGCFFVAVLVWAYVLPSGVCGAMLALLFSSALTAACLGYRVMRDAGGGLHWPRFRWATCTQMGGYAKRAYSGTLCQLLSSRVDALVIGYFLMPSMIGQYSVAAAIADRLRQLSCALSVLLVPRIASVSLQQGDLLTARVLRLVLIAQGTVCALLAISAHWVVVLMFGRAYREAVVPLVWLMPGALAAGVTAIVSNAFAGRGQPEAAARASVVSLCLFVALGAVLIPPMGLAGAAIAWSLAATLAAAEITRRYLRTTGASWKALVPQPSDIISLRSFLPSARAAGTGR